MHASSLTPNVTSHLRQFSPFPAPSAPQRAHAAPAQTTDAQPVQDRLRRRGEASTRVAYESYYELTRLSLRAQHVDASITGTDGATAAAVHQLEFQFFHEIRAEQLTLFHERTSRVADRLENPQRANYLETSRAVAARFSASVNVSVSVLHGFAGASEAASGSPDTFVDKLIEFTNELLAQFDDVLNEAFSMLDDMLGGESGLDIEAKLQEALESIQAFLSDFFSRSGNPQPAAADQGTQQVVMFEMQLEFNFSITIEVSMEGAVQQSDPITFDLDGDGIELTNYARGARFDILGSGTPATTAFVTGGDAFLAMDRNQNGRIDSGLELFGDQRGAANGFEELRKLDSNRDGVIDTKDDAFDSLLLFRDNGNGVTEPGELISLSDAGIASIDLRYRNVNEIISGGNRIAQTATYRRNDGSYGHVVDSVLNYIA